MAMLDAQVTLIARRPEDERFAQAANACLQHLILTEPDLQAMVWTLTAAAVSQAEEELRYGGAPMLESAAPFRGILDGSEPLFGRRCPLSVKGLAAFED